MSHTLTGQAKTMYTHPEGQGIKPAYSKDQGCVPQQPAIFTDLDDLDTRISALQALAERLEERLNGVLIPSSPSNSQKGSEAVRVGSPISERVRNSGQRLIRLYDVIDQLINRLEI